MRVCWAVMYTACVELDFVADVLVDEVERLTVFMAGEMSNNCGDRVERALATIVGVFASDDWAKFDGHDYLWVFAELAIAFQQRTVVYIVPWSVLLSRRDCRSL